MKANITLIIFTILLSSCIYSCTSTIFSSQSSERCTWQRVDFQKLSLKYGEELMKVNFIDLDSFEKIDKHNRTSNLNAYYSSTSILTLDHLETINLKLELIKSGYDLSSVHCIVVYTTISKDTLQLIPSDIKGVLIYHVDKSGQLVASVFQYSNSKYSMIEDLKGYTDFTTFNQFENVSNKLPYKDNEYKSAIIIGREKSYRTKRKNRYEFDSKLRSQLIGNTDLDPVKS